VDTIFNFTKNYKYLLLKRSSNFEIGTKFCTKRIQYMKRNPYWEPLTMLETICVKDFKTCMFAQLYISFMMNIVISLM